MKCDICEQEICPACGGTGLKNDYELCPLDGGSGGHLDHREVEPRPVVSPLTESAAAEAVAEAVSVTTDGAALDAEEVQ